MRILVYGAGVLGCNLAHAFYIANKDVTLLSRGEWYEEIKNNGLTIHHRFKHKKTNEKINVINKLKHDDKYDAIFVVLQYIQLDNIIDVLRDNISKNIIFVGNNMNAKKYVDLLKDKTVLFGFFSAAGKRENNVVKSFYKNEFIIGRIDNLNTSDIFMKSIFEKTKIKLTIENKMDDWLKNHVAFILPFVGLAYYSKCDYRKIKHDNKLINKCIDAVRENYDILSNLGYDIIPKSAYDMVSTKRYKCFLFAKLCGYTILGDVCICDHAKNGKNEMISLNDDFMLLKENSKLATKNSDLFERYIVDMKVN